MARDWSAMRLDCLFLDATYAGCRVSGRVRSEALVTAIGVGDDGRRRLVGLACANAESYASWRGFLQDLEGRGVRNVRLVTSDAHDGLAGAIREVYPEATWQRRVVHARRDVLAKIDGREAQRRARAAVSPILGESDPTLVRAPCHEAVDELASFAPDASRVLEDAEVDALAYLSFPREHRAEIRTNNARERTSRGHKRRAKGRPDVPVDGVRSAPARRHRGRGGRRLGIREPVHVEGVPQARPGAREGRESHRGVRPERGGEGARRGHHDGGA
nr:transposase [Olsenella sp. oral taxon 807]